MTAREVLELPVSGGGTRLAVIACDLRVGDVPTHWGTATSVKFSRRWVNVECERGTERYSPSAVVALDSAVVRQPIIDAASLGVGTVVSTDDGDYTLLARCEFMFKPGWNTSRGWSADWYIEKNAWLMTDATVAPAESLAASQVEGRIEDASALHKGDVIEWTEAEPLLAGQTRTLDHRGIKDSWYFKETGLMAADEVIERSAQLVSPAPVAEHEDESPEVELPLSQRVKPGNVIQHEMGHNATIDGPATGTEDLWWATRNAPHGRQVIVSNGELDSGAWSLVEVEPAPEPAAKPLSEQVVPDAVVVSVDDEGAQMSMVRRGMLTARPGWAVTLRSGIPSFVTDAELDSGRWRLVSPPAAATSPEATPEAELPPLFQRMIVCPECGNKRCPKATDDKLDCTGSNDPGQPGSRYVAQFTIPAEPAVEATPAEKSRALEPGDRIVVWDLRLGDLVTKHIRTRHKADDGWSTDDGLSVYDCNRGRYWLPLDEVLALAFREQS